MSTEWPTTHRESEHMAMRQRQNRSRNIPAEKWMAEKLKQTRWKWTRQARQGYRLFDFWSYELGVAIEVDGPNHVWAVDEAKDIRELLRSGIVVFRVKNFNEDDVRFALALLPTLPSWNERRTALGLKPRVS